MGGAIVEIYMNEHANQIKNAILFAPATAQGIKLSATKTVHGGSNPSSPVQKCR